MQDFRDDAASHEMLAYHCPRYQEFPRIELYMDQVLTILEEALRPFALNDKEKLITSTMVNNYVKQGVVMPPKKKRYSCEHLAYLMTVCILKQVLPLSDICQLISCNYPPARCSRPMITSAMHWRPRCRASLCRVWPAICVPAACPRAS